MKPGNVTSNNLAAPGCVHHQRGVVLLLALIILVAMTLAGIGMMRSVDTGNLIAGNMAFRQATMSAGDAGTSAGFNALVSVGNSGNGADKIILNYNNGQPCPGGATAAQCGGGGNINLPGYSSTPLLACEVTRTCPLASNYSWWAVDGNWNGAPSITMADPNGGTIATVSYLIHRMCQSPGLGSSAAGQLCQTYTQPETGCSKSQLLPCTSTSVFYRITSRSVGARGTVAYAQTLVLIAQ
jgi:Tfp pilus assembly protein PilX